MKRIAVLFWIPTLAVVLTAVPARAQDVVVPPVEIGALGSGLVVAAFEGGGGGLGGAGSIVSIAVSRGVRLDLIGEAIMPDAVTGVSGLYQIQGRFPMHTSRGGAQTLSMTVGAAGFFSHQRFRENRLTRPDGSIVVRPGFTQNRLERPRVVTAGIAYQQLLTRRASLMLGAQTLFSPGAIVLRGTAGVSFGIRRYR